MLFRTTKKSVSNLVTRAFATTNKEHTELNLKYMAHNYGPGEPVIESGERCWLTDVEGRKYLDFHSGYCATNQGHCHPKIVETLIKQAKKLAIPSRAFDNDQSGPFSELMSKTFGYNKILPSSSGVEACETAVKLARRWGYVVKGVPDGKAEVLFPNGTFWGRSIAAISGCDDPSRYAGFGPLAPGFPLIPYDDLPALEKVLSENPNIVAYMVEPIQGEGGVIIPQDKYLSKCQKICKKYNVLMISDEIQSGLGRAGKMLCSDYDEDYRPDMVTLGKSLSGGMLPVSVVLADDEIMLNIKPGEHGNTFGGNALACATSKTAIEVLIDEEMCQRSIDGGAYLIGELSRLDSSLVKESRGKGLF
jgi:ornithine--oxo-acid transaminase